MFILKNNVPSKKNLSDSRVDTRSALISFNFQGLLVLLFHVLTNGQVQKSLCEKIAVKGSDVTSTPDVTEARTVDSRVEVPSENLEHKND